SPPPPVPRSFPTRRSSDLPDARRGREHARPSGADDDPPPGAVRRPARGLPHLPGLPPRPGSRSVLDALMPLLRSWDVGTAREPARRAGLVIGLAQLPPRPPVRLLSR